MIIILDQFTGPTPYSLQAQPIKWDVFLVAAKNGELDVPNLRAALFLDRPEDYKPHIGTTAYIERDGFVSVWRTCWDTSG